MKRKLCLLAIVLSITAVSVFAQDLGRAKNIVAVQFGILGGELSYEYMFGRRFSVLGDISYTTMFFMDEFTVSGKARWYPFAGAFYLDMGLGYSYGKGMVGFMTDFMLTILTFGWWLTQMDLVNDELRTSGFLIQPGLGWKIDIGKQDRFMVPIGLGLDIKISNKFSDVMPYLRVGLAYAF